MSIRNYIRVIFGSTDANGGSYSGLTQAYFDNFRILDGTTEEVIDGGIANKLAYPLRRICNPALDIDMQSCEAEEIKL